MLYWLLMLVLVVPLLVSPVHAANTFGEPSDKDEMGRVVGAMGGPFVASGCQPAVPSSSLTITAFSCTAFVHDTSSPPKLLPVIQAAVTVTVANVNGTHWLALHRDTSTSVSGWTRRSGSHYLHQQTAAQPADPSGGLVFAQVTVSGNVITAVSPTLPHAYRDPVSARLRQINVATYATGGDGSSARPWTGWDSAIAWSGPTSTRFVFAGGYYSFSSTITLGTGRTQFLGAGPYATVLTYTGTGTAISVTGGATQLGGMLLADFALDNTDTTNTKIGIDLVDLSYSAVRNVTIGIQNTWVGSGSVGIRLRGRDNITIEKYTFSGDKPIQISVNPNISSIGLDQTVFRDLYLIGSGNTYPLIEAINNVLMTNVSFEGYQSWVKGQHGFIWHPTNATSSQNLSIKNVRWEQSTNATGYGITIQYTTGTLQNFLVENFYSGSGTNHRGVQLRGVRGAHFTNYWYAGTDVAVDFDNTVYPVIFNQPWFQAGATVTATGLTTVYDAGQSTLGGNGSVLRIYDLPSSSSIRSTINGTKITKTLVYGRQTITYSASMTLDADAANHFTIVATNGTAFTINAPLNPVDGMEVTLLISNQSGGALGVVTWNAALHLAGAWTSPATGFNRSITFRYDSAVGGAWYELYRTAADVAN